MGNNFYLFNLHNRGVAHLMGRKENGNVRFMESLQKFDESVVLYLELGSQIC